MPQKIVINPVTRISGFMEIETDIESGSVSDARIKGLMFRGFEKILVGRSPFDAVYFTERICGICSSAHSVASAMALESAMNIVPSEQGRYLRDIIHGCEFLQNHLHHFFQYTLPDYVRLPVVYPLFQRDHGDYRLPEALNEKMAADYFKSLDISRSAHQMLAILGGKAPHNHGVFIGGITSPATADMIIALKSILHEIEIFIYDTMIPDVFEIGRYYPEYFFIGRGYGNLLSYGCFNRYRNLGTLYVDPLVYTNGKTTEFHPDLISQDYGDAWYNSSGEPSPEKPNAYSFIKAPRYEGMPYEVGPLARQWLSGAYTNGISAMDRTIARALEAGKIASVIKTLLDHLMPDVSVQAVYSVPLRAEGRGLIDTTRGALGHWLSIDNGLIARYQIITPSAWNLSVQTGTIKGTAEKALIGAPVNDVDAPVEIGRIIRSFDPCVSCATHVFIDGEAAYSFRAV